MYDTGRIKVDSSSAGKRFDQFLSESYPDRSRSYFNKLIKKELALINGAKAKSGYILREDDEICITFQEEKCDLSPIDIPLDIVYEDNDIIVINKAAGIAVHPGKGTEGDTLVNALLHHTSNLALAGESDRPGIVHRLDKYTSGLLVTAKNDMSHRRLREQFDLKTIHRIYWALVWGSFNEPSGTVHTFINRSKKDPTKMAVSKKGKEAVTHYEVLKDFEYITLLQLKLETGRTHQIRVHMNYIHHQILADPDYNGRESQLKRLPANLQKRGHHLLKLLSHQALHAKKLSFLHPKTNEIMEFESPLPEDMALALEKLPQLFLLDS